MKLFIITILALIQYIPIKAQQTKLPGINQFADLTGTVGSSEVTIAAAYVRNWRLGKKRKLELGIGARATWYSGTNKTFYTAPSTLTRSTTVPFAVVFSPLKESNIDTLTVRHPSTSSLNITLNIGYNLSTKWYAGINIDLIGFTVSQVSNATLQSNGLFTVDPSAKPTRFNVLLTGDDDYGSLNSEFFIKYKISDRWNLKAVYQFYITEYKTTYILQTAPDGTTNNRFRNKVNAIGLGVSYDL